MVIRTAGYGVVIAGGGPAGMMAGLLFARAGVRTLVMEKHGDFLRDFRGDTVHPSTLEVFTELGLIDSLLRRPFDKMEVLSAQVGAETVRLADFRRLPVRCGFIALMPQWDFLDFIADEARKLPNFELMMSTEVIGLIRAAEGRISGFTAVGPKGEMAVESDLAIVASGRGAALCDEAGLARRDFGAPMDALWLRVPKPVSEKNVSAGRFGRGHITVLIDRGDYWQVGYVIPKGGADAVQKRGLDRFRQALAHTAPVLTPGLDAIRSWDDVKLLEVKVNRLVRWWRPGLIAIGDAAHAMSPIGGVGINLAVQDAVAASNILARPLAAGKDVDSLLSKVQQRRLWPTRVTQTMQLAAQKRIIGSVLAAGFDENAEAPGATGMPRPPWPIRLIGRLPVLQRLIARLIGLGVRPEHVRPE